MVMKVIFFGTPDFAADILQALLQDSIEVLAVVTRPDRPKGRSGQPAPSAVKVVATAHNLPLYQPGKCSAPEFVETLASYQADLFVVVAYGEIVKDSVLALPKLGCINVHASLLPKYRGAAPIHRAVIAGETKTGVSIMYMVREMDAGDVIKIAEVPIGPNATYGEIEHDLRHAGAQALLKVIRNLDKGIVERFPQDHSHVTFAKKIELEDCEIHWDRPATDIHNLVRGTNPFPGAWCHVTIHGETKRLKILRTLIESGSGTPGTLLSYGKDGIVIACSVGAIRLVEVKPEGKRAMKAEEMARGIPQSDFIT